jgi:hypothetical protein
MSCTQEHLNYLGRPGYRAILDRGGADGVAGAVIASDESSVAGSSGRWPAPT